MLKFNIFFNYLYKSSQGNESANIFKNLKLFPKLNVSNIQIIIKNINNYLNLSIYLNEKSNILNDIFSNQVEMQIINMF